jgi:putative nucleotidyltransferase with HDIG domain
MIITIPAHILYLFRQVEAIISPVYLVGGSVRDILLGVEPSDYDFATPLLPDEIELAIRQASKRPYLIGKSYGTVGFKLDGQLIEVTTFRTETYSAGSRKPTVTFINDLTYDLSRRDFTINAIALRIDGTLIDPFNGHLDITNSYLRTVNKAYDRYNEDPLRMLRTARFATQLNFTIDAEAEIQTAKKAYKILEISRERWVQELDKLLVSQHVTIGLEFLAQTRLLHFMLPELAIQVGYDQDSPYHQLNLWDHTVKTVSLVHNGLVLRWAALLHDVGKPYVRQKNRHGYSNYVNHELVGAELVTKIGRYLHWSNARTTAVHDLVRHHLEAGSPLDKADSDARFRS